MRYRFRDIFESSSFNEFRIIEQLEFENKNLPAGLSHRIRVEQRFRENTIHRIRYEIGLASVYSVEAATEALYSLAWKLKPKAEQRVSIGLENTSFEDLELGLTLEFQLENYNIDPEHEFFIITEGNWEL